MVTSDIIFGEILKLGTIFALIVTDYAFILYSYFLTIRTSHKQYVKTLFD